MARAEWLPEKLLRSLRRKATYTSPHKAMSVRPWHTQEATAAGELWPCILSSEVDLGCHQALLLPYGKGRGRGLSCLHCIQQRRGGLVRPGTCPWLMLKWEQL